MQALNLGWDDAYKKQKSFFREYGTSLRGMMEVHNIPAEDYLEYDHIIPVSKGGSNTAANIQLLCRRCNGKKSDKI